MDNNNKYICEIMIKGLCAGCVGLAEKDWIGKYECKYYKEIKQKLEKVGKQQCLF